MSDGTASFETEDDQKSFDTQTQLQVFKSDLVQA